MRLVRKGRKSEKEAISRVEKKHYKTNFAHGRDTHEGL